MKRAGDTNLLRLVDWAKKHPVIGVWISAIIIIVGGPAWLLNTSSPYQQFLSGLAISKSGTLDAWFIALVVGILVIALFSVVACLVLAFSLSKTRKQLSEVPRSDRRGRRDFDRFTGSLRSVIQRLDRRPNCETELFHVELRIFENGNVEYKRTHSLRANNEKTVFHVLYEEADASAEAAPYFCETGLAVKSLDPGTEAILLPTENTTHRKEFAICFIPPLSKGQARRVEISHTWPGYCSDLVKSGRTSFYWQNMTANPAGTIDACVELRFPPAWKGVICRNSGASSARSQLEKADCPYDGVAWVLRDPELPSTGELSIECVLENA